MSTLKLSRLSMKTTVFYNSFASAATKMKQPNYNLLRRYGSGKSAETVRTSNLRLMMYGVGIGATVGTIYATYNYLQNDKTRRINKNPLTHHIIDELPNVKITRKIYNSNDKTDLDLILFQYQTCPFCCKVRAFLDSKGLSYSVVEVDAVLRQSIKWSPYKKVPMLLAKTKDGKYVQLTDSTMIISALASYIIDPTQDIKELASFYPINTFTDADGKQKNDVVNKYFLMYQNNVPKGLTKEKIEGERKWRTWADEHLVHLISPNVYRTRAEALETFEWFSDVGEWHIHFPAWERNLMVYVGAIAMWGISKRLKKRHNLSDNVRWHLYSACNKWTDELNNNSNQKFHGGKIPNLADLAVFGILNSMEGCQAFDDCLQNTKIGPWFYAMKDYVNQHKGVVISELDTHQQQILL